MTTTRFEGVNKGDILIWNDVTQSWDVLSGSTDAIARYLRSQGTGSAYQVPSLVTLGYEDVGAEASGAVSSHAGLTTGVHGAGAGVIMVSIPPADGSKKVVNVWEDPTGQLQWTSA